MKKLFVLGFGLMLIGMAAGRPRRSHSGASRNAPGEFDYYLLTLSWAPDFCAGPNASPNSRECGAGNHMGFVVHGLWPQFSRRGYPEACAPARPVSSAIVDRMLPIMPDAGLIQHEWREHGTCSGLSTSSYFALVRKAFEEVKIPKEFQDLGRAARVSPAELETQFAAANPTFPPDAFRAACSRRQLNEVRVCFSRDLSPQACTPSAGECRESQVLIRPVR